MTTFAGTWPLPERRLSPNEPTEAQMSRLRIYTEEKARITAQRDNVKSAIDSIRIDLPLMLHIQFHEQADEWFNDEIAELEADYEGAGVW